MPYVDGESLKDRLERERQLPLDEAVRITCDIAGALDHAHRNGVIHRDVKPANILLKGDHAVLADFGVAQAAAQADEDRLTGTGIVIGTPAYMSPEQATGVDALDGRSDLFSLGCVLYEMLVGEPPFTGPTTQVQFAKMMSGAVTPISRLRPSVPERIERSVMKALATVPADRHDSARDLAAELASGALTGRDRHSRPRGRQYAVITVGAMVLTIVTILLFNELRPQVPLGVAVLPPEVLTADSSAEFFARGLHDELISRLWSVGLRAPSRPSMTRYRDMQPPVAEIAERHDVSHLLHLIVRWGADSIWITATLVDAADRQVGREAYAVPLTVGDLWETQSEIARKVASELAVELTPTATLRLAGRPTRSLEAYQLYLGGKGLRTGSPDDLLEAERLFEQAVEIDPRFAEAWAELARIRLWLLSEGLTDETISVAREAIDRAVEIGSDLPATRFALAFYEGMMQTDLDRAAGLIEQLYREQPGNVEVMSVLAAVRRDQGRWREAQEFLETVLDLEPGAGRAAFHLGFLHLLLHEYEPAERYLERAVPLESGSTYPLLGRVYIPLMRDGDVAAARHGLQDLLAHHPAWKVLYEFSKIGLPQHSPYRRILLPQLAQILRDSTARETLREYCERCLWLLQADLAAGMPSREGETAYHDSIIASSPFKDSRAQPSADQWREAMILAQSLARVGDARAVPYAEAAAGHMPPTRHAYLGPQVLLALAEVYLLVGNREAALDRLQEFATHPSAVSANVLRNDPLWAPARDDPRFPRPRPGAPQSSRNH